MIKHIEASGYRIMRDGSIYNRHGYELRGTITQKGYRRVTLILNGKETQHFVHRLVALKYIPRHPSATQVNHIDEDKLNNDVVNLEWCTAQHNNTHGTRTLRASQTWSRPVACSGGESWLSATDASRAVGTCIHRALSGRNKTCAGMTWRYI